MIRFVIALSLLLLCMTSCTSDRAPEAVQPGAPPGSDPALVAVTQRINANPERADLYAERAVLQYDKENFDGAIADLQRALSIDSTNVEYHWNLAEVYLDYYRSRLALRTLERAVALDPDNLESQLRLAEIQLITQQYDDAISSVNQATRIDQRNPEAYYLLAQIFAETGDTARAVKAAEEATQIDPDMTDAYLYLGKLFAAQNNPRAERYYDAAIGINPNDTYALHSKGDYLRDRDRISEAIEYYRRASLADRQYVAGHFNAGLLLMELDSVEQARREFDITVKNDPLHIRGFFFRGYASELLGETAAARSDYERALRMAPDYELALEGLQRVNAGK